MTLGVPQLLVRGTDLGQQVVGEHGAAVLFEGSSTACTRGERSPISCVQQQVVLRQLSRRRCRGARRVLLRIDRCPACKRAQTAGQYIALSTTPLQGPFRINMRLLPTHMPTKPIFISACSQRGIQEVRRATYFPLVIRSTPPFCRIVGPLRAFASFCAAVSGSCSASTPSVVQSRANSALLGVSTALL